MDQNLEPKTSPPLPKLNAKRINPADKGYYFLGATSSDTFVGYIKPAMTDAEIKEYIEVQERLEPPAVREAKARSRAAAAAENANISAGGGGGGGEGWFRRALSRLHLMLTRNQGRA